MNYIEAFKKKFNRLPTEEEIAILMEAVADQEQTKFQNKSLKYRHNGFVENRYKGNRGEV
tara:strand:+ start:429 stop:608 length:180 start_codon:yes stop_codon:yes gene_type:complete